MSSACSYWAGESDLGFEHQADSVARPLGVDAIYDVAEKLADIDVRQIQQALVRDGNRLSQVTTSQIQSHRLRIAPGKNDTRNEERE
jgi:hypothetical protein